MTRARAARATATMLVAAFVFAGGCKGKSEISGIGPYHFGTNPTTRAAIYDGICQPTELEDGRKATWCFALPPIKVGKRVAEVDAYFLGQETEANSKLPEKERKPALQKMPLIEVQFKVRGCVEAEAEQWLRERTHLVPDPKQSHGALEVFQNSFLWVGALLPSEPGRCLIHVLPKSEATEIERIKATIDALESAPSVPPPSDSGSAAAISGSAAAASGSAAAVSGSAATTSDSAAAISGSAGSGTPGNTGNAK